MVLSLRHNIQLSLCFETYTLIFSLYVTKGSSTTTLLNSESCIYIISNILSLITVCINFWGEQKYVTSCENSGNSGMHVCASEFSVRHNTFDKSSGLRP